MTNQTITNCTGTVTRFNGSYGFIESEDVGEGVHIFVHYQEIEGEGYRRLYEADRVVFTAVLTPKGWQARGVVRR